MGTRPAGANRLINHIAPGMPTYFDVLPIFYVSLKKRPHCIIIKSKSAKRIALHASCCRLNRQSHMWVIRKSPAACFCEAVRFAHVFTTANL